MRYEKNYIEAKKKYFPLNKVNIQSVKLDDINFDRIISGLKIDVEGHEPQVIKGAINYNQKYTKVYDAICTNVKSHQK